MAAGGIAAVVVGIALVSVVLRDAFETMVLPRRLKGRFRLTRAYFTSTWPIWAGLLGRRRGASREAALSLFGPLSMLLLFVLWAVGLIVGFSLIYYGMGSPITMSEPVSGFGLDLYVSGSMFLTLGLGNAVPHGVVARSLAMLEGGMGFGFVAVVISYLPVLYSGFSQREANITMLDARAGSPPAASELLRRHAGNLQQLEDYLAEWERWAAQLLESHISYPVLGFFRSQHVNQSWLAALTTLLDACAVMIAGTEGRCHRQAQLTFAMTRHAVVDLAQIYVQRLPKYHPERLSEAGFEQLNTTLASNGLHLHWDDASRQRFQHLRSSYEPQVHALAQSLHLTVPAWIGDAAALDNWQRSPWERGKGRGEQHF
ncbi:MAG: two pore domain potassium channel family protein [Terriglobales bacterium]